MWCNGMAWNARESGCGFNGVYTYSKQVKNKSCELWLVLSPADLFSEAETSENQLFLRSMV